MLCVTMCKLVYIIAKHTDDVEFMFVGVYYLFLHSQQEKMAH
jgi:hypothetical protein